MLIVGERLARSPRALSAAAALSEQTAAKLAWVPRRAGDRGAIEAGCLPNLMPGGRPVADASARAELATEWGLGGGVMPNAPGRDTDGIIAAAAGGTLGALVVAGVDPADLADPRLAEQALESVDFLVSFEVRSTAVTRRADVVFPVAPVVEKAGTFVDWEGRTRHVRNGAHDDRDVRRPSAGRAGPGVRYRHRLLERRQDPARDRHDAADRRSPPGGTDREVRCRPKVGAGEAILASWHHLLDLGSLTDGDVALAGTARPPVVRRRQGAGRHVGVSDGDPVTVGTDRGAITLPVAITDDMADGVVWLPTNSPGSTLHRTLGVSAGAVVTVAAATPGGAK